MYENGGNAHQVMTIYKTGASYIGFTSRACNPVVDIVKQCGRFVRKPLPKE